MEIRCMHAACWIPKATNTHLHYVICNNTYVSLYVNCLPCCNIFFCAKRLCRFSFKKPSTAIARLGHHKIWLLFSGMISSVKPCKCILQASILCGDMYRMWGAKCRWKWVAKKTKERRAYEICIRNFVEEGHTVNVMFLIPCIVIIYSYNIDKQNAPLLIVI
jgi:hypothetical protein